MININCNNSLNSVLLYFQSLSSKDFSGVINSAFSGLFSIIAILPASYALIIRYVEKQFCGMPVAHLQRYKVKWLILPLIYLLVIYCSVIASNNNILTFSYMLLIFSVYLGIYLYFMLIPLYNKNKFYKILTRSLSKWLINKGNSLNEIEFYIIETIKSINNENDIPIQFYLDILSAFKKRVKGIDQINISYKLIHLVRLLFLNDAKFFIELNDLEIALGHKYLYINSIFKEEENLNINSFSYEAKKYFSYSLKEYLKLHSFDTIKEQAFTLIDYIRLNKGLALLLTDIYNAEIYDLKYIEILYLYLTFCIRNGVDLYTHISNDRDIMFLDEFKEIIEGKKNEFITCSNFTNKNVNVLEIILKSHIKETK